MPPAAGPPAGGCPGGRRRGVFQKPATSCSAIGTVHQIPAAAWVPAAGLHSAWLQKAGDVLWEQRCSLPWNPRATPWPAACGPRCLAPAPAHRPPQPANPKGVHVMHEALQSFMQTRNGWCSGAPTRGHPEAGSGLTRQCSQHKYLPECHLGMCAGHSGSTPLAPHSAVPASTTTPTPCRHRRRHRRLCCC